LKVLIVDDDRLLVKKIADGLDWEKLGVDTAFTANDAQQARSIIKKCKIQLLITDIEMPGGSGLELVKWVQREQLGCKCIFISSHASFHYAQEAIKLQSSQYLLKPVSNKELEEVIALTLNEVRRKESAALAELKYRKRQLWMEYLEGSRTGSVTAEVAQSMKTLYEGVENFFVMMVKIINTSVRLYDQVADGSLYHMQPISIDRYQIQEAIEEAWAEYDIACEEICPYGEGKWVIIGRGSWSRVSILAKVLAEIMINNTIKTVLFFRGRNYTNGGLWLEDILPEVQLLAEVAQWCVWGDASCLDVTEWSKRRAVEMEQYFPLWKETVRTTGELHIIGQQIINCVEKECACARMTKNDFLRLRMFLSQLVFMWMEQEKLQSFMLFDEEEFRGKYADSIESLENMRQFVRWQFEKLEGYLHMDIRRESVIRKVKVYIEDHMKEEISRKGLAGSVYLSEDYVSRIFRDETGMSLSNYVTGRRMEKAQEYLRNTDWGISRIAMEVGYTNFSYFSKTFKEYTGCTPNEYRKKA